MILDKDFIEQRVIGECSRVIKTKNLSAFNDFSVETIEGLPTPFMAYITMNDRRIYLKLGHDYGEALEILREKGEIITPSENIVDVETYMIMNHEHGHHQICPTTKENFQSIMEGAYDAIEGREFSQERILTLCANIHNMFSDTVLNTVNSHIDSDKLTYRQGFGYTYLMQVLYSGKEKKLFSGRSSKDFTLFLDSSLELCQIDSKIQQKISKAGYPRFFTGFNRKRKKIIDIFTGERDLTDSVLRKTLNADQTARVIDNISNESKWKKMAYDYTNIVYPYMDQNYNEQLENSFSKEFREGNGEGIAEKKPEIGKGKEEKRNGKGPEIERNGTGKKDEKGKKIKRTLGKGEKSFLKKNSERNNSTENFSFSWDFQRLDDLYKQRAGRIKLVSQFPQGESPCYEKYTSSEEMDGDNFDMQRVDWARTRIVRNEDGGKSTHLYRESFPLKLEFESTQAPQGIADLSFIFDSSNSMVFKPFEGEGKGEYHTAVLTFYSVLKNLEELGVAHLINYNVINFSSKTFESGWHSYDEIDKVKQTLLNHQNGSTCLNAGAIRSLFENRKDNFMSFMLTDTDMNDKNNALSIAEDLDYMVSNGTKFKLFRLGGLETTLSKAVKKKGLVMVDVDRVEDFMNGTLFFTNDVYGGAA